MNAQKPNSKWTWMPKFQTLRLFWKHLTEAVSACLIWSYNPILTKKEKTINLWVKLPPADCGCKSYLRGRLWLKWHFTATGCCRIQSLLCRCNSKLFHSRSHVLICICGFMCDRPSQFKQEEGQHACYHLLTQTNGYSSAYSSSSSSEYNFIFFNVFSQNSFLIHAKWAEEEANLMKVTNLHNK